MENKITIQLTRSDYETLLMMLGFANGSRKGTDGEIPPSWKEVTDWVLLQGGAPGTHLYFHEREPFLARKQAELD